MSNITLALPSKGAIAEPTYAFLKDCGLKISKPNPRQYTGTLSGIAGVDILFQRVKDIVYKVGDGTVELGITGYDVVCENPHDELIIIHDALGYGHCKLVVAVPESWVDVDNMQDLNEISIEFRHSKGRNLRIATTYPASTREFFHKNGIHHFTIVKAEGAIEAAPTIGYADIVVDLTQTGTTLRENHLKTLEGGTILQSQACLIGNRRLLLQNPQALQLLRVLLEYIDASLTGGQYDQITVNIKGASAEAVGRAVAKNSLTRGLLGPNISPIFGGDADNTNESWFTVNIVVPSKALLSAVEYLRSIGGQQIIVSPISYIFMDASPSFSRLQNLLYSAGDAS